MFEERIALREEMGDMPGPAAKELPRDTMCIVFGVGCGELGWSVCLVLFVLWEGGECFEEVEMEGRESMYDVLLETALVTNGPCIIKV